MTPNFLESNELLKKATEENLFVNLVTQLQKDFTLANIDIEFSTTASTKGLLNQLQEKIYFLLLEKFMEYLNLMYIIDVPEKAFKDIKEDDIVEVAKHVSFLILKREWQKVWYKAKYSK